MADGYVLKSSVLSAIHNGDIDMGMVTPHEYRLLKDLSERIDRRIQRVPAADVRPVVFCRDCDCWNEWDSAGRESLGNYVCSCAHWSVEDGAVLYTSPTDFCSYGERKEES